MKTSTSSPSKDTTKPIVSKDISAKKAKDEKVKTVTSAKKKAKYETVGKDLEKITFGKIDDSRTNISNMKNEPSTTETIEPSRTESGVQKMESKFDMFKLFCKLCGVIASVSKYSEKTAAVKIFINKGMIKYIYICRCMNANLFYSIAGNSWSWKRIVGKSC